MKRLLIFAAYFKPNKGGHEKYVFEIAKGLQKKGWKIDIVTALLPGTISKETINGLNIYRVPIWHLLGGTYPIPKPKNMRALLKKLAKNKYCAVNTHTRFFPSSLWGIYFSLRNKIPNIHIEHGTCHPKVGFLFYPLVRLYDHTIGQFILKKSYIVAGVSKSVCTFIQHIYKRKTIVLPNCVDTSFFKHVKVQKSKNKQIVFIGRLIKAKGVQDLIEATKKMSNVKVLVVGSGKYESKLKKLANQNTIFAGEKNSFEIRKILSAADIFVNPSYAEGLPTCVLEAGALGLPVIATNVGGTKEIIDNNVNGFLIRPKNACTLNKTILSLLKDNKLRRQFGKNLQKKIKNEFDWNYAIKKFEQILTKLDYKSR